MMKVDTESRLVRRSTANYEFKQKFNKYFSIALLCAVLAHLAWYVFFPPYNPEPYRLREKRFEVVDVPPELIIPPPPQDIQRPEIPQELEISEEASEEEFIAPTSFDPMQPPVNPGGSDEADIFMAFDQPPVPIHTVAPRYPDLARQAGIEGVVNVLVTIDEKGRVVNAINVSTDANPLLVQPAIEAARKWLFTPAKQRDVPVRVNYLIPIGFKLSR
jgi:protein TonB